MLPALLLGIALFASQEDEPGAARVMPTRSSTVPLGLLTGSSTPTPALDPAWSAYHRAFALLAEGKREEAQAQLRRLRADAGDHPAALLADDLLERMAIANVTQPPPPSESGAGWMEATNDGGPTGLARAELAVWQTIFGITFGANLCVVADCNDARGFGALIILGGGTGLTLSLIATQNGITPGHAMALNTGTSWGVLNGLMVTGAAMQSIDGQVLAGLLITGQLLGLGAGELAWRITGASQGDVSLVNSGGLWGGVLTLFLLGATEFDLQPQGVFGVMLGAVDAGLISGAVLSHFLHYSRGHVLIIDGGGAIGTLLGLGVAFIAQGDSPSPAGTFITLAAGTMIGLGTAAFFTRDWDRVEAPPVQLGLLPLPEGGGVLILGGRW